MLTDWKYALRSLLKTPGFTLVAVLTLALGIGANTAIFAVVDSVLLSPLGYKDSGALVTVLPWGGMPVAPANYLDWRDQSHSFAAMGAVESWSANLAGVDQPEQIVGMRVTHNFLPMLGVEPLLGRLFVAGSDLGKAVPEVVLSYALWQRRFEGNPGLLGKSVKLDGEPYTVVGVMPPHFKFMRFWATNAEFCVPIGLDKERAYDRSGASLRVLARLRPHVTLAQARTEMAAVTARLEREYPGSNGDVVVTPLREQVVGKIETPLLLLFGAVGFVLLIACANVAHMLLARGAARQKEMAVRLAVGAGRWRLVRQLLTENILLASAGGGLGLLISLWGIRVLVALSPASLPGVEAVGLDVRVLLFLVALVLVTCVGVGLAPALQTSDVGLNEVLKETGRAGGEGVRHHRLRNALVASEFGLALMLLIGAGLMTRSFIALQSVDPGFNPHRVLSMVVPVAGSSEAAQGKRESFYRLALERIRVLPGVESVAGINHLPLVGDTWSRNFSIDGRPQPRPGEAPWAIYRVATPGYFYTVRLPVLRGRDFSSTDNASAPPVVILNERAAQMYWPGQDPIGQHILFSDTETSVPRRLTIIGVVKDAKQWDWVARPHPEMYLAAFQSPEFLGGAKSFLASAYAYITLVVRTAGDPGAMVSAVKKTIGSFDRNLPVTQVVTLDEAVTHANDQPRFEMLLFGVFAGVALLLSAVGVYGVMSYAVSRRTHEIGIRISLGASRHDVLRLVVGQGMQPALIGSGLGLGGAFVLSRLMRDLLYGVQATDLVTFAAVPVALLAVALLATYIPATRATRVDPLIALRTE